MAACPACWAMGIKALKKSMMRKKYFVLGRVEQPRCRTENPEPARQAQQIN